MLHRQILSQNDLNSFLKSEAFKKLTDFLELLNSSVRGCKNSAVNDLKDQQQQPSSSSLLVDWCQELISAASNAMARFPPQDRQAEVNRFGSPAFREWMHHVQSDILPAKCEQLKGKIAAAAAVDTSLGAELCDEAQFYFANAMGSSERIDYGTGHELHFLIFLLCIHQLQRQQSTEMSPSAWTDFNRLLVLKVFRQYIQLMSQLQRLYWLEPAGSHGVWGLDDYHFLPFLFGAAQLIGNTQVRPKSITAPDLVEWLAEDYLYFEMVDRIMKVKQAIDIIDSTQQPDSSRSVVEPASSASLRWLSPVLDDISAVKTWDKVNSGLLKMYRVEVLGKLPIMQHCLFGNHALPFQSTGLEGEASAAAAAGHYTHSPRGDCCGNPLPSIYSASQQPSKVKQPGLPFD